MRRRWLKTPSRLQRVIDTLGAEGEGRGREAWAIGLGLFIGSSPLLGFHLGLCIVVGWVFGLNRLKLYLAASLVGLVLPTVLFVEVQAGALLRRGVTYPLSLSAFSSLDPWLFGLDLALGSLVVGGAIGGVGGLLTFVAPSWNGSEPGLISLMEHAADR